MVKMLGSLALERPVRALLDLLQGEAKGLPQCCNLVTVEPERRFVTADDPVECIWILLQGKVKAKEEYPSGDVYVFRKFTAPEVFGEMEALADLATFRATLVSETKCTFLVLPVPVYVEILKSNPRYLYRAPSSYSRTCWRCRKAIGCICAWKQPTASSSTSSNTTACMEERASVSCGSPGSSWPMKRAIQ